jgi:transketolase
MNDKNGPKHVVIEGGGFAGLGRDRYVGSQGKVLGMKTFGMSAPIKVVTEHFGFVPEQVVAEAKKVLARAGK